MVSLENKSRKIPPPTGSYECSPTQKRCNLNPERKPGNSVNYGDYNFCVKTDRPARESPYGNLNTMSGHCNKGQLIGVTVTCSGGNPEARDSCSQRTYLGQTQIAKVESTAGVDKSGKHPYDALFDGDLDSFWKADGPGKPDNPELRVDFFLPVKIYQVGFLPAREDLSGSPRLPRGGQ